MTNGINSRLDGPIIHPGIILKEEFLDDMDVTPYRLAKIIDVPANRITEMINGKRSITADTALRFEAFFGLEAQFWMNLQTTYDLRTTAKEKAKELAKITQAA